MSNRKIKSSVFNPNAKNAPKKPFKKIEELIEYNKQQYKYYCEKVDFHKDKSKLYSELAQSHLDALLNLDNLKMFNNEQ